MGKSMRQQLREEATTIKQMFTIGYSVPEIAKAFGVDKITMYEVMRWMGFNFRKSSIDENKIFYADNSVKLEKVVINGKRYTDITPLFAPR